MANLPEKNITTVNKVTSIPSNTNVFINANGEFVQASINDIVKASNVVSDATLSAVKDVIDNQFKTYAGSPILAETSAGNVIDFTAYGRSEQKHYTGKNLWEFGDVSGTATVPYTLEKPILAGTYTMSAFVTSTDTDITTSRFIMYDEDATEVKSLYFSRGTRNSQSFTVSSDIYMVRFYASRNNETSADDTFTFADIQIESGSTATDFEPYVGGTASPNPTYPQPIKSVGDSGYSDGELLQGYYAIDGSVTSTAGRISAKNLAPCSEGDEIHFIYEEVVESLVISYFKKGTYSSQKVLSNTSEIMGTVPSGVDSFGVSVFNAGITPQTAKHICVTINGMYALIQKHVNKNLLENTATSLTKNGGTFTVNADKSVTVKGTFTASTEFFIGQPIVKEGTYIINGSPANSGTYGLRLYNGASHVATDTGSGKAYTVTSETTLRSSIFISSGVTIDATFYPMLRLAEITDDTYVPHEEQTTYIPLTEPLRGIGEVKDSVKKVESVWNENRKFIELVFDGSDNEYFALQSINNYGIANFQIVSGSFDFTQSCKSYCTHFSIDNRSIVDITEECYCLSTNTLYFRVKSERCSTVEEWKALLAENPIKLVVEVLTPISTPFAEQTPFYNMKTFDGVTHISASDDAEMEIEVPTSKVAGISSEGWAKGNLAQIQMDNITKKLADIQTAMINM